MQKTLFENENMIEPLNPAFCIGAVSRSTLLFGDCLIESDKIKDGSVDLILTDLPYGTVTNIASSDTVKHGMQNKTNWDCVIETEKIYEIANRILRKNGKMVLFAQQPFTTELISKQIPNYTF
jgi:DNA modification methylase